MEQYRLVPEKYRFLSGSALKLLAVASMLCDHIALCFLQRDPTVLLQVFGRTFTLYKTMRLFGRIAFPLFAFLLVEGFAHTRDRRSYGLRLLIFALISEIPWNLMLHSSLFYDRQNVLFTLFLGFAGLCTVEALERDGGDRLRNGLLLVALFALSAGLRSDYGGRGFCFILLLYLLRERPLFRALVGTYLLSGAPAAGFAFIPIAFYSGKRGFIRGRVSGLAFYAIYPLHMLVLYLLRRSVFG